MAKLAELLATEKVSASAWNTLIADTLKKFGAADNFFSGHSKSLKMIEGKPENAALEAAAREEKPVITTVHDTLEYALEIYGKYEDHQFRKNQTNRQAVGTVMWNGTPLLVDLPVDELLGLEARLGKIRELFVAMPTVDAAKHWKPAPSISPYVCELAYPEDTTKTEKVLVPVVLKEATKEHPAQVQAVNKDIVVGTFSTVKRSGAATAVQKSEAIKRIDDLLVEVKRARQRANETTAEKGRVSDKINALLLEPF